MPGGTQAVLWKVWVKIVELLFLFITPSLQGLLLSVFHDVYVRTVHAPNFKMNKYKLHRVRLKTSLETTALRSKERKRKS